MAEGAVALAALGAVMALLKIFDYLLKRGDKTIKENTEAGRKQAKATDNLALAVTNLNGSILERDARDREFHVSVMKNFEKVSKSLDNLDKKADRNYDATVKNQTVAKQTVEKQIVQHEIVQDKQ